MRQRWRLAGNLILAMAVLQADTDSLFPQATMQYYTVSGDSIRQLQRELQSNGPRDDNGRIVHGLTHWQIEWELVLSGAEGSCTVADVRVGLKTTVTLPRWEPRSHVQPAVVEAWERYLRALRQHEFVHYRHGVKASDAIRELAEALPPGDCGDVERAFNIKAMRVMDRYRLLSRVYDERTRHGALQGAVLD